MSSAKGGALGHSGAIGNRPAAKRRKGNKMRPCAMAAGQKHVPHGGALGHSGAGTPPIRGCQRPTAPPRPGSARRQR